MLQGKLTYITAFLNFCFAVYGFFAGLLDGAVAIQLILASLAVFGLRRAISNI